jgi:hypothetical protein
MSGDTFPENLAAARRHVEADSSVRALRRGAAKGMLPEKKRRPLESRERIGSSNHSNFQHPASAYT